MITRMPTRLFDTPAAFRGPIRTEVILLGVLLTILGVSLPAALPAASLKLLEVAGGGRTYLDNRIPFVDGRVLVSADDDGDGIVDLFSVAFAGGAPVRLNEPLADPFTFAYALAVSPDGSTVVYGVDGNAGSRLYSVPLRGPATASVRLDVEVAWDLDFNSAFISGDGQRMVFEGNQDDPDEYGIFSVPIDGPAGAMVRLDGPLVSGGSGGLKLTPDGLTALYLADQDPTERREELYAVPVDGSSAPVLMSGGGSVGFGYLVTDTHVVYYRDRAIYSTPLAGTAADTTPLSITPAIGEFVRSSLFRVTPDGQTLVYRVSGDDDRLYAVPIDGPANASIRLTPAGHSVVEYRTAGNGMVVYDQRPNGAGRVLYGVPITGPSSAAVRLSRTSVVANGSTSTFQVSPDGSRVVFQAILEQEGVSELWSTPVTGPASESVKLNPPLASNRDVFFDFAISPDSRRVAYRLDLDSNDVYKLYSVGIDGAAGPGVELYGPLAPGGDVCANGANCYRFAPDSRRVVFEAEVDADREIEVLIADDGQAAAAFRDAPRTVYENTTVVLTIDLGAPSVLPVTLKVAQTGGSASAADYALTPTVVIAPGETTAEVPLQILADGVREPGETLELSLTDVENADVGLPFSTVLTIRPEGEIFFSGFE